MWYVPRFTVLTIAGLVFLLSTGLLSACGTSEMTDSDSGAPDEPSEPNVPAQIRELASSQDVAELNRLDEMLRNEDVLKAWDSEFDYQNLDARSLNLAEVLHLVVLNSSAANLLMGLADSPLYNENDARILLLTEAFGNLPEIDGRVVSYWSRHSAKGSIFTPIVIDAAFSQGSLVAAALLGERLYDPDFLDQEKVGWLHRSLLPNRDQPGLLLAAADWLEADRLTTSVRTALIESLFDYQPEQWYPPGVAPRPPDPDSYTAEAQSIRRDIAEHLILSDTLDDPLKRVVQEAVR